MEDAVETISIKEYVDRRFAQQDAKNGQARAETQKNLEKVRSGNAELNTKMDAGFAELRAEMDTRFAKLHAKIDTGFAENKASQLHQLRWIVGAIFAAGSLIIAAGFFT